MKLLFFAMFLLISAPLISEEGRLGREANDYKYTSLGIDLIQSEGTDIGAKFSFKLPGPLYVVIERKAENVNTENKTYDRVINGARIGAHSGIGDLLSNVSAKGVNLGIKNVFDLYGEIGIKSVSIEGNVNSFSENEAMAHLIAGIRFGDSNGWEGKIFIDYSKESEVIQKTCPQGSICPALVEYILDEETDQKFGAGILYNINNRSAITAELTSSKVFESSFKIGYQINF